MTISATTAASAGRFIAALPTLDDVGRVELLRLILEVAYAEGAQHMVQSMAANMEAARALDKAKAT